METHLGFILNAKAEDLSDQHQIQLFGIGDDGPFVLTFTEERPLFFVDRNATIPTFPFEVERKSLPLKSLKQQEVDALYFKTMRGLFFAKDMLQSSGVKTFEADVRTSERLLMERFIHGSLAFKGDPEFKNSRLKEYRNPQLAKAFYVPTLSVLSLDIETSMTNDLYSIAIHYVKGKEEVKKILMVGEKEGKVDCPLDLTLYPTEQEVLEAFLTLFRELDPDVIIGWHVIGFDLLFLDNKFKEYQLSFSLGRNGAPLFLQERPAIGYIASIDGRLVIDGPSTMRGMGHRFENFRLETVAQELLGKGKDIESHNEDKIKEINYRFHHDKEALARYNLMDCELVSEIFAKIGLLELLVNRSLISGLLIEQLNFSTRAFDHFYLPRLHRKGYVSYNVTDLQREFSAGGGYVLDPVPGLHEHVLVFDFKSLYPSVIRTFKIDPLGLTLKDKNTLKNPTGIDFSATEHILPSYLEELMQKRQMAKEKGDRYLSEAIKLLMNSFYGVMGSSHSRFYHADLPEAITQTGQWVLKEAMKVVASLGYQVIYGDTDSLFVKLNLGDRFDVEKKASFLVEEVNKQLKREVEQQFPGATSCLDLQYQNHYLKLFLPTLRDSEEGAKKKYVGLKHLSGKEEIIFSGMEFVRSDWTQLAKNFQYEIFRRFFAAEELDVWIRSYVENLKNHQYDEELTYRRRLTKKASEYTKSIPSHVKAALMLGEEVASKLREVEYVITYQGPVPLQLLSRNNIDYEHYIDKQLRPLADMILSSQGKSFEEVISGQQLSLF